MRTIPMTIAVAAMLAAPAFGLPPDETITYEIHEDPQDPESRVIFVVKLALEAEDSDSSSVGWRIAMAKFRKVEQGPDTDWIIEDPYVPTADGLWWVEHADIDAPALDEFTEPPHLSGTADPMDPSDPDLDYDLQGVSYVPPEPPEEPPYFVTTILDYIFWMVGEPEPEVEGDEEPADTVNDAGDP